MTRTQFFSLDWNTFVRHIDLWLQSRQAQAQPNSIVGLIFRLNDNLDARTAAIERWSDYEVTRESLLEELHDEFSVELSPFASKEDAISRLAWYAYDLEYTELYDRLLSMLQTERERSLEYFVVTEKRRAIIEQASHTPCYLARPLSRYEESRHISRMLATEEKRQKILSLSLHRGMAAISAIAEYILSAEREIEQAIAEQERDQQAYDSALKYWSVGSIIGE